LHVLPANMLLSQAKYKERGNVIGRGSDCTGAFGDFERKEALYVKQQYQICVLSL